MQAIYHVLGEIRRELAMDHQVKKDILSALREMNRELEYARTERERMARVDRVLERLDELSKRDERIEGLIEEAMEKTSKLDDRLASRDPGTVK